LIQQRLEGGKSLVNRFLMTLTRCDVQIDPTSRTKTTTIGFAQWPHWQFEQGVLSDCEPQIKQMVFVNDECIILGFRMVEGNTSGGINRGHVFFGETEINAYIRRL
jgi:hypothetical protein